MAEPTALICPPLGGKFQYSDRHYQEALERALREKDEAESREIAALRLIEALLLVHGDTEVSDTVLREIGDGTIRTEHNRVTGSTRVWRTIRKPRGADS